MINQQKPIKGRKVDVTPLFDKAGIPVSSPIQIIETVGMYPYKEKIEDNWAYYTAVGVKRFKETLANEGKRVKDIGIVGICSGVEGIAVIQVFKDGLEKLIITDVDDEILEGTVFNLANTSKDTRVEIIPLVGSFCEPIEQQKLLVDFVHANIPNLPARETEDLSKGAEKGTFLPAQLYDNYDPPPEFEGWALAAQYAYLTSARKIISKGGSVITELGGRVPYSEIRNLFEAVELKMEEVIVGFKEQTEALIDFEGYHRLEKAHGTHFEFYKYKESVKLLEEKGLSQPSYNVSGEEVKRLLEPYKVSAGEALELFHQGTAVGHTVHLFRGINKL
jgi:hypothetical protein